MELRAIELGRLRERADHINVMSKRMFARLKGRIDRTGLYPPLVVRPRSGVGPSSAGDGARDKGAVRAAFEVLDGVWRLRALRELGHERAWCVLWRVDDAQAATQAMTLNRLRGRDEPYERGRLIERLVRERGGSVEALAEELGEPPAHVRRYMTLRQRPKPCGRRAVEAGPSVVHFVLDGAQRDSLERALERAGGKREAALMRLVESAAGETCEGEGGV